MQDILHIKKYTIGEGMPLICVPIMYAKKDEILAEAGRLAAMGVPMVEWRVDTFERPTDFRAIREVLSELAPIVKDTVLVFTFRSKKQGGTLQLPPDTVSEMQAVAAESGVVDLIDVEYFMQKRMRQQISRLQSMGARILASHHDFGMTPSVDVMDMILERMQGSGADIVKLAVMPQRKTDVLMLLEVTESFHQRHPLVPLVTMSMGSMGCISRVAGETFGSCITFASGGMASAPGQLPVEELHQTLAMLHKAAVKGA